MIKIIIKNWNNILKNKDEKLDLKDIDVNNKDKFYNYIYKNNICVCRYNSFFCPVHDGDYDFF